MSRSPSLSELLDSATPFALPLRRRFRGLDVREGMLIEGPSGWGEFAPFDDYSDAAAARWLACALEAAFGTWPDPVRDTVPVNAIIPAVDSADAALLARTSVETHGCRTVKVKVGDGSLHDDEARVAAVRDVLDGALGAGVGAIRIDANAAWDVTTAAQSLRELERYSLQYVEQPCRTREELLQLRRLTDVPIAVDETIRLAADPGSVRVGDVADVAVLKAAPLGGVRATLDIAAGLDVPVVISGSLDSSVGLDAGVAAAAALPDLAFACGLGTGALLAEDVAGSRVPVGGVLSIRRTAPDRTALASARERVSAERVEWWRQRIAAAWAVAG